MFTAANSETILYYFCGFGVLQGILLAGLLYFHHNSDRKINRFLALYIFCTSVIMALPFFLQIAGWRNSFFIMPFPLLPGPLLYLYLLSFKETVTVKKAAPHFIAFVIFFFLVKWNLIIVDKLYPNSTEVPTAALRRPATMLLSLARIAQQLFYYFLARKTLIRYQDAIRHLFSETSRIDLSWAKFLVNGYLVLVLTFVVIFPLILSYPAYFNLLLLLNMAVGTPYLYVASYRGFRQLSIWQAQPGIKKEEVEAAIHSVEEATSAEADKPKTAKTGVGAEKIEEMVQKITWLMEHEKLYQETELTLQQLAAKLQVPNYQVSQALNEGMSKSFYDLINGYRVEEAKRLLANPDNRNYTILSVGFEAGFNSKTTFNTVFKKFSGLTPTAYRDKFHAAEPVNT